MSKQRKFESQLVIKEADGNQEILIEMSTKSDSLTGILAGLKDGVEDIEHKLFPQPIGKTENMEATMSTTAEQAWDEDKDPQEWEELEFIATDLDPQDDGVNLDRLARVFKKMNKLTKQLTRENIRYSVKLDPEWSDFCDDGPRQDEYSVVVGVIRINTSYKWAEKFAEKYGANV